MKHIFKNWKTTMCGLALVFTGVKQIILTGDFAGSVNTILGGIGLIVAKDFNISGSGQ
jgi:hypothetical protein